MRFQTRSVLVTARVRSTMGGYVFTGISLSVHTGGGIPHLHHIILPLVPCRFQQGDAPSTPHNISTGQMSFLWVTPVTGPRSLRGGTLIPGQGVVPQAPLRVPQSQAGVPPGQGWGAPQPGQDGVLPRIGQQNVICGARYASCAQAR